MCLSRGARYHVQRESFRARHMRWYLIIGTCIAALAVASLLSVVLM
jgi:hypothetical protein